MKKIILLIPVIMISALVYSQSNLVFEYDAAGNCVVKYKTIVLPMQVRAAQEDIDSSENEPQVEKLGDYEIFIYPNPTKGILKIEIKGSDMDFFPYQLFLFDTNGRWLMKEEVSVSTHLLDLSAFSSGTYILRIKLENKQTEWKIIKQ